MQQELETIKKELENTRKTVFSVLHLLERMSAAMQEGFDGVNQRLAELESSNGLPGVNENLSCILKKLRNTTT